MNRRFLAASVATLVAAAGTILPSAPASALTGCSLTLNAPTSLVVDTAPLGNTFGMTVGSPVCGQPKRWLMTIDLPGTDLHKEFTGSSYSFAIKPYQLKAGKAKPGVAYKIKLTAVYPDGSMANNWLHKVAFKQDTKLTATPKALGSGKVQVTGKLQRYDWAKPGWTALSSAKVFDPVGGWSAKTNSKGDYTIKFSGQTKGAVITPTFMYRATTAYDTSSVVTSVTVK